MVALRENIVVSALLESIEIPKGEKKSVFEAYWDFESCCAYRRLSAPITGILWCTTNLGTIFLSKLFNCIIRNHVYILIFTHLYQCVI